MSDLFIAYDPAKEPGDRLAPEVVDEIQIIAQAGVDSVVGSADLEDGAVTTAKIADLAVTDAKLASNSVTTSKIAGNAISSDKLGPGSVTPAKAAPGIVTSEDVVGNDLEMVVVPITAEQYAALPEKDPNTLYLITDGNSSVEVPGGGGGGGGTGTVGPQGPAGPAGAAATIAVGSTTTGAAGSSAAVTNSGSSSAAVFDFVIPRGEKGETGQTGLQGAPGLGIKYRGEVQSLAELNAITGQVQGDLWVIGNRDDDTQPAESYIWDEAQADWLYGGRIQGPQGVPGKDGADSTVPGPAGSDGAPGADGAPGSPGEKGDRGDPGDTGAAATIAVGTTTTGAAGAAASVSNTGTPSAAVFDFVIPAGVAGADGAPGADGADGAPGPTAVSADADNASTLGSDGLIYTPLGGGAVGPQGPAGQDGADGADGAPGPTAVSADADNASVLGTDGLIYTPSLLDAGGQLPESALPDGVELQANKGVNNGYASLDAAGKLPSSQLPLSALEYKGTWDAATNTPPLVDGVGTPGDMWRVTVTGTQFGVKFTAGDFALFNGTKWETATSGTAGVSTVAGLTGDVAAVPLKAALELDLVDNTADATKSVLSATKLTTPRSINGVAFDGTANITVEDDTKEPVIAPGTATQYLRGDKTWQELPAAGGGLVTAPSVADFPAAGEAGKVYLAEDSGDTFRFDATARGTDTYVRISETTVAAKIEDSTQVGRDLVTAVDEAAARATIGAENAALKGQPDGYAPLGSDGLVPSEHLPQVGPVDLRDWPEIRKAEWKMTLGAEYTSGQKTLKNNVSPFTADDVGKVVVVSENNGTGGNGGYTRFMAKIVSVDASGVATMDTAAPSSAANQRIHWGFDATAAINAALASLAVEGATPREAYLPGRYRASQIVIPTSVTLRGSGWGSYGGTGVTVAGTIITQLPGSEKSLVVFSPYPGSTFIGPFGLSDINLCGPEANVRNHAPTKGSGVSFRNVAGDALAAQDGCVIRGVQTAFFPENGFELPKGGLPLTLDGCRFFYNGKYGFDYDGQNDMATQMIHLLNCSADGNVSGGVRFRNVTSYSAISVTAFKSEADSSALYGTQTGWGYVPGWAGVGDTQMEALIFEDCDSSPITVCGVNHVYGGNSRGPGPAIRVKSATTKVPRIFFSGIAVRALTGTVTDSVTLRDSVNAVDIPLAESGGSWPPASPRVTGLKNKAGDNTVVVPATTGVVNYLTVQGGVATGSPTIGVQGIDATASIALAPRGAGGVQIYSTSGNARLVANGNTADVNIKIETRGNGQFFANSDRFGIKVAVPANSTAAGKMGYWACNNTHLYIYTGDNTTHSWSRLQMEATWTSSDPSLDLKNTVKGSLAGTPTGVMSLWTGSKAQYDAIPAKSGYVTYVVTAAAAVTGDITVDEGAQTGDISIEPVAEPVADEPVAEPVADEPVADEPVADEPVATTKTTRKK